MSVNNWVESELERRVSEIRHSADVDIATAEERAIQVIARSMQENNNEKNRKHRDSKFSVSLGVSLFSVFFFIGGCYGTYSLFADPPINDSFINRVIMAPFVFIAFGLIIGGIAFAIGLIIEGVSSVRNSSFNTKNEKKYSELTEEAKNSANQVKDEEIRVIVEKRNRDIRNITDRYNDNVKQAYEHFFNSSYVDVVINFIYTELKESVSKANHASYIKNLNVVMWFHVYMDRIITCTEEYIEEGTQNINKAHILNQKQFVLKHQMLINLETYEQCDALTEAIIEQLKKKIFENDEFASVNVERRGSRGKIKYKTPNPDVKQFIGF